MKFLSSVFPLCVAAAILALFAVGAASDPLFKGSSAVVTVKRHRSVPPHYNPAILTERSRPLTPQFVPVSNLRDAMHTPIALRRTVDTAPRVIYTVFRPDVRNIKTQPREYSDKEDPF